LTSRYVIDTGILGVLCHPRPQHNPRVVAGYSRLLLDPEAEIFVPEIADYELRREFLFHIRRGEAHWKESVDRLNAVIRRSRYLPLDTGMMRRAAEFWADARSSGRPTADPKALDGDVILAAQAEAISATVITRNPSHLELFVPVETWDSPTSQAGSPG
jgi:predicted nucleic acid-binding protein